MTLILDLASTDPWVGCVHQGRATVRALPEKRDEAALLPAVHAFLRDVMGQDDPLSRIERILAVTGPGGFMSLRVGIALANALAWGLHIPLAGIHLSDLWAARCTHAHDVLWLHSTKRDALFVRGCGACAELWPEPTLISLTDLQATLHARSPSRMSFVGDVLPAMRETLPMLSSLREPDDLVTILPSVVNTCTYHVVPLEPWYGREG